MTTETRAALNRCIDKLNEKVKECKVNDSMDSVDRLNAMSREIDLNQAIVVLYNELISG